MQLAHIALLVDDYDEAIAWFERCLGFGVARDEVLPEGKRWVVVAPPGGGCSLVLAKAANTRQRVSVGNQFGGRVGLFLHCANLDAALERLREHDVRIEGAPRAEPYGRVAVFRDHWGNRWDLVEAVGNIY